MQDMIDDPDCPVSTECLKDTFESLDLEFKEKINGYGKLAKNTKACIDAIANEQRRLAKKKKALENKLDNLKEAVAGAMLATGREKMKTELFSLYGLKVDKLVVGASDQIPDEYKKESVSLVADKDKTGFKRWRSFRVCQIFSICNNKVIYVTICHVAYATIF